MSFTGQVKNHTHNHEYSLNNNDNGYIRFPNGFTIQWGNYMKIKPNQRITVDFPKAFQRLFQVVASHGDGTGERTYALAVTNKNNGNFTLYQSENGGTYNAYWIAVGLS